MALFFDQDWFQERLLVAGRTHDALASAAGLTLEDLAAVWKDQMEVTGEMVAGFAEVLNADPGEIASRCGLSTPNPPGAASKPKAPGVGLDEDVKAMLSEVLTRLARLEKAMDEMQETLAGLVTDEPEP